MNLQEECFHSPNGLRSLGLILLDGTLSERFASTDPFHYTIRHQDLWIDTAMWRGSYIDREQLLDQLLISFGDGDGNYTLASEQTPPFDKRMDLLTQIMTWFQGTMYPERGAYIQGALNLSTQVVSWANGSKTVGHGSHVNGVLQALDIVDWHPVLILIHVIMHDPEFAGPTKSKLDVPHVTDVVRDGLLEPLRQYKKDCLEVEN